MQQMLSLDVADTCGWVLQTLNFNVADVEFRCCKHVMPSFVLRRKGRRAPDVECGTQHGSQHDRNMRGGEERLPMLDVAHNLVHNTLATSFVECWKHDSSQHGKSCSHGLDVRTLATPFLFC
jgi:hypothetical protein